MIEGQIKDIGRIGVLMGGCSSERDISIKSGTAVLKALKETGCDAVAVMIDSEDPAVNTPVLKQARIQAAFIAMHGRYGEDGGIQSLLECLHIPYAGSKPAASRLAMNKHLTQEALRRAGLPIPDFCVVTERATAEAKVRESFGREAVVVKPVKQGSSIGVHIVMKPDDLKPALDDAFRYDEEVLVERFIHGRELTAGILGGQALPIVEIRSHRAFFDFEAKYQKGLTEYIVPAELSSETTARIQALALSVFDTIGCRDFARVDFLLDAAKRPYILEVNTIPGFTGTSLLPMAARCAGYEFPQLCVKLIMLALEATRV